MGPRTGRVSPEKEKIKGELRELIGERFKTYNKSAERQIAETEETIATAQERLTGGGERSQPGMPVVTSRLNSELLQLVVPDVGDRVPDPADAQVLRYRAVDDPFD